MAGRPIGTKTSKPKGGCSLRWKRHDYALTDPVFIDQVQGLQAFPALFRMGLKSMGVHDYLRLSFQASIKVLSEYDWKIAF